MFTDKSEQKQFEKHNIPFKQLIIPFRIKNETIFFTPILSW